MKQDNEHKVYEDALAYAVLTETPCGLGHVIVYPKKQARKIEELDDETTSHLFFVASYTATGIFEALGAHGTNILVNEGHAGTDFCIHVIARFQEDGINFLWQPQQVPESEQKDIQKRIDDETFKIGQSQEKAEPIDLDKNSATDSKENREESTENYLIKQLKRIP